MTSDRSHVFSPDIEYVYMHISILVLIIFRLFTKNMRNLVIHLPQPLISAPTDSTGEVIVSIQQIMIHIRESNLHQTLC